MDVQAREQVPRYLGADAVEVLERFLGRALEECRRDEGWGRVGVVHLDKALFGEVDAEDEDLDGVSWVALGSEDVVDIPFL